MKRDSTHEMVGGVIYDGLTDDELLLCVDCNEPRVVCICNQLETEPDSMDRLRDTYGPEDLYEPPQEKEAP